MEMPVLASLMDMYLNLLVLFALPRPGYKKDMYFKWQDMYVACL
jgi:hypothetical protein